VPQWQRGDVSLPPSAPIRTRIAWPATDLDALDAMDE